MRSKGKPVELLFAGELSRVDCIQFREGAPPPPFFKFQRLQRIAAEFSLPFTQTRIVGSDWVCGQCSLEVAIQQTFKSF